MSEANARLDLYSISQTKVERCAFGAPLVALIFRNRATIQQACCNHWECPVCGITRAKEEYRRIVFGAEVLADEHHKLYFWTLTCRGKECSLEEAEENYVIWTNRLLTNARTKCNRAGGYWAYVQVTERQHKTRHHPHSHLITSYVPSDACIVQERNGETSLSSVWFDGANKSAGLGAQHRISAVGNPSAVSRYIAKYLFKDMISECWPKNWRRVRYSNNWPKPNYHPAELSIPLLKPEDWQRASEEKTTWVCEDDRIFEIAYHRLANICKRVSNVDF